MFSPFRKWLAEIFGSAPPKRRRIDTVQLLVEQLEDRCVPSTITVTGNGDGLGSVVQTGSDNYSATTLRRAILLADALSGPNTIDFNIKGMPVIKPTTALPTITGNGITIDGATQPGYDAKNFIAVVTIDGSKAGVANGLTITGNNNTVKGVIIVGFMGAGIEIDPTRIIANPRGEGLFKTVGGDGNVIINDIIGTNAKSNSGLGNGVGVFVNGPRGNIIGGAGIFLRDVISGNMTDGVRILSINNNQLNEDIQKNVVNGDYIGTDLSGMKALPNGRDGVRIEGGDENIIGGDANHGGGNVISGNQGAGIDITANNRKPTPFNLISIATLVEGNIIGLGVDGKTPVSDGQGGGILITAGSQGTTVGGDTPGARNIISDNTFGVEISQGSSGNTLIGDYIGTDRSGEKAVGNRVGVLVDNTAYNRIGGTTAGEGDIISGNRSGGISIIGMDATGNQVFEDIIGLSASGTDLGNGAQLRGITISDSPANLVSANVISDNAAYGLLISGATGKDNVVSDNYIGTNEYGTASVGFQKVGVFLENTANHNLIGRLPNEDPSLRNIISGNQENGIFITGLNTTENDVFYNYIGTDVFGSETIPNGHQGVLIQNKAFANNLVGNVISGNGWSGVSIVGTSATKISENLIGVDALGKTAIPNGTAEFAIGRDGIWLQKSDQTTITENVISGNKGFGIDATGNQSTITANIIGLDKSGNRAVPNFAGILIAGNGNTVGGNGQPTLMPNGFISGLGNVLSGNNAYGVAIIGQKDKLFGNLIGTDLTGLKGRGNGYGVPLRGGFQRFVNLDSGVILAGATGTTVGGKGQLGNVISYNHGNGVTIEKDSTGNQVLGNTIGLGKDGTKELGNLRAGVFIDESSSKNTIAKSKIAFNKGAGVVEQAKGNNTIDPNLIYDNGGGMGIQLSLLGERLHVTPLLESAVVSGGNATVIGTLQNLPNTTYLIEFFNDNEGDRDGEVFLGSMNVTTDGSGFASFQQTFAGSGIQYGFITATSTFVSSQVSSANPGTSEYSIPAHFHIPTATAITSSQNPSLLTQPVTFTAVVAPTFGTGTPTGAVEFFNGTNEIGAGQLAVVGGSDQATFTTSALGVGTATITAVYVGDANFNGSFGSTNQIVQTPTPLALGLFNTGTNANDQAVTGNPIDLHYTVQGGVFSVRENFSFPLLTTASAGFTKTPDIAALPHNASSP